MSHILELAREHMKNNTTAPVPPAPTEKAQIGLVYSTPQMPTIVRFNSVKKAMKFYTALHKAWAAYKEWAIGSWAGKKPPPVLFMFDGDMFDCTVDLSQLACVNFVDIEKRFKFIPIPNV